MDNEEKTALTHAIDCHSDGICKLLLAKMSDEAINHINGNGDTALTIAASNLSIKICELLIPKMSIEAINHADTKGKTALSLAETKKFTKICNLLKARQEQGDQIDIDKIVTAITIKLESDTTTSTHNKNLFKEAINKITSKIPNLTNTSDIAKITASIKKLEIEKITRGKLIDINDELIEIISGHPIDDYTTILGAD